MWFVAGYLGLAGFFGLEAVAREGGEAASLASSSDDQGTTRTIVLAFAIGAVTAPLLRRLPIRPMPRFAAPSGFALEMLGLGLRAWSMRTLRGFYSRTLRTAGDQEVVDTGPYRVIRHPSYLGSLLIWTGFALTSRSRLVLALVAGLLGQAYVRRIAAEEQLLRRELRSYVSYSERTKKLVPLVW